MGKAVQKGHRVILEREQQAGAAVVCMDYAQMHTDGDIDAFGAMPRRPLDLRVDTDAAARRAVQPGDEFEIKLGRQQIRLVPAGASDDDA